ncbi:hypothetical protein BN946_scf184654.g13 [Trametes cinnabarina]|uniref:Uncharacterized protein n=1 Tax=Pycnoporus cinnabarinus TaxID=5643 RepID=A0A060SLR2_PYCCI|nr:hypothetical protein BN946_scf184654.g13 [Trametes cinnabarina]
MHTRPTGGIDTELTESLEHNFTWVPPLTLQRGDSDVDNIDGSEGITGKELKRTFDEFEHELRESRAAAVAEGKAPVDGSEVLKGHVYDFAELDNIDMGGL